MNNRKIRVKADDFPIFNSIKGDLSHTKAFNFILKSLPKIDEKQTIRRGKKKILRIKYVQEFEL